MYSYVDYYTFLRNAKPELRELFPNHTEHTKTLKAPSSDGDSQGLSFRLPSCKLIIQKYLLLHRAKQLKCPVIGQSVHFGHF